jgi:hypothetical protein
MRKKGIKQERKIRGKQRAIKNQIKKRKKDNKNGQGKKLDKMQ